MTAKFSPVTGFIRLYKDGDSYESRDAYIFIATVQFLTEYSVYIGGAKGELSSAGRKEIHALLRGMGVTDIMMERRGKLVSYKI